MATMIPSALAALWFTASAVASGPDEGRVPLPEPLLVESTTDVDSDRSGEFELDPAESALPATAGVHGAIRRGIFTFRGELAAEAAWRSPARVSVRGGAAVLAASPAGFLGLEIMADQARGTPVAFAAELSLDGSIVDAPLRLGLAVPWTPTSPGSLAVIVGLVLE